jgi:hypothetical protein
MHKAFLQCELSYAEEGGLLCHRLSQIHLKTFTFVAKGSPTPPAPVMSFTNVKSLQILSTDG